MRLIFIAAVLFFLNFQLWADNNIFNYPLKPETLGSFNRTCVRLAEHPIIKGNFEQEKRLNRLDRSLKSSGNFIIASEFGMVWETLQPFPSTMVLGNNYMMQFRPGGQKTVLSDDGNETFIRLAEILSAVFSGRSQTLINNFTIYYNGGSAGWELGLVPLDSAVASFALNIIMKGDSAIRSIVINEQNGDSITYSLFSHTYPAGLNANERNLFTLP